MTSSSSSSNIELRMMTASFGASSSTDLSMDDFYMLETTPSFNPRNPDFKPTPSPMTILDTGGEVDDRGLKPYEQKEREEAIGAAKKTKAISQTVLQNDAIAELSYKTSHHRRPWSPADNIHGNGFQITSTPCNFYERLYFYHLPAASQASIRAAFHRQLHSPLIQLDDARVDTLLFSNKTHFESACRSALGKEAVKQLKQTEAQLTGLNATPKMAQETFDTVIGKKTGSEKRIILKTVAIEMAVGKDNRVLGGSWSGLSKYTRLEGADHSVPPPATLRERAHFHSLPLSQQNDVRMRLFGMRAPTIQETLGVLEINTETKLSSFTGGKYTQYAQLVSDDMLFRDRAAYRSAAAVYLS